MLLPYDNSLDYHFLLAQSARVVMDTTTTGTLIFDLRCAASNGTQCIIACASNALVAIAIDLSQPQPSHPSITITDTTVFNCQTGVQIRSDYQVPIQASISLQTVTFNHTLLPIDMSGIASLTNASSFNFTQDAIDSAVSFAVVANYIARNQATFTNMNNTDHFESVLRLDVQGFTPLNSSVAVHNCAIQLNRALLNDGIGGILYINIEEATQVSILDTSFMGNNAGGGSVVLIGAKEDASVNIVNTSFVGGTAALGGGLSVFVVSDVKMDVHISKCYFYGITADLEAAVYANGSLGSLGLVISDTVIKSNRAYLGGGAVYALNCGLTMTSCSVTNNIAHQGTVVFDNSLGSSNHLTFPSIPSMTSKLE
eukprot:TRINITY_DN856_c1_g1_i1.p1 TRINITY_DN856_c1_g1~~TRINITY_DN856_c1_g1_i1.p1  ORF type:complete len:369 (+),score=40.75 TRINITY_DN856_c1_g1_i1:262-1368(+)